MKTPRELLDPNSTLPQVELETVREADTGAMIKGKFHIVENDERVGHCSIEMHRSAESHFAHFDGVEIHEENYFGEKVNNRGRGLGLATYILAIELAHSRGFDFETQNWTLTEHAVKVWEHMAARSVAQVVRPFEPAAPVKGQKRFNGKYRVPAPR